VEPNLTTVAVGIYVNPEGCIPLRQLRLQVSESKVALGIARREGKRPNGLARNISCGAIGLPRFRKKHAIRAGESTGRELRFAPHMAKPPESVG